MTTAIEERTGLAGLREDFRPIFEHSAAGAVQREQDRQLPFEQVELLKQSGFTALRVPAAHGGRGVGLDVFLELLLELATADSNVAHLLRGHVAHVETLLRREPDGYRAAWLDRLGAGELVGNAASERGELTEVTTQLTEIDGKLHVSGEKYYTTGSIYADWISLSALQDGERVNVMVDARHPGVTVHDDWDGFGQQLTGSGGLLLEAVPVDPADVTVFAGDDSGFRIGLFQTVLLVVAAGIAQNAVDDAVAFVKPRRRTFAVAGESSPATEPVVQTVVGEAAAKAYAAAAIVRQLAARFARFDDQVALEVFKAQQVVLRLATDAATEIFEVGGASATSTSRRLDRHWRNARTVASHNPAKYRAAQIGRQLLEGAGA